MCFLTIKQKKKMSIMFAGAACLITLDQAIAQPLSPSQMKHNNAILDHSSPAIHNASPVDSSAPAPRKEHDDTLDTDSYLFGDLWGLRTWLDRYGITFTLQETDELWGVVKGGMHRGAYFNGVTAPVLTVDLEKLIGLEGGIFNVSALQIHGRSVNDDSLMNLNALSGFESDRATRLFELWYQQSFLDHSLDIKIGQQDLDTEFMMSQYAGLFINASFGWPLVPSTNLHAGGPSWPLASPAVRLRYRVDSHMTFLFAAADDNPPGVPFDDPDRFMHPSGTNFNLGSGALLIGEMQFSVNPSPEGTPATGMPGIYRLGGFYDTGRFADQRYDTEGHLLASPESNGKAARKRGNWMLYAIMDQMVWRPAPSSDTSLGIFARVNATSGDRNCLTFGADAGFNLKAPLPERQDDTFGIGWGMGRVGNRARAFDRDSRFYAGSYLPVRSSEHHMEVTYQAQVRPWLSLQPDFQYIWNPGAGTLNPLTGRKLKDEAVLGLHSNISF